MLLVLQIAQYEAVALEVKKLLLVLFWTVFRIMLRLYFDMFPKKQKFLLLVESFLQLHCLLLEDGK